MHVLNFVRRIRRAFQQLSAIESRMTRIQEALGRIELRQAAARPGLEAAEFRVFSQWGEDGLLQALIRKVLVDQKIFVEFGVQDYSESNTRFLLVNDNWSGLIIDGSAQNIESVKRDEIYWRHNLKAICAFVSRENINELIASAGIEGDIGLLSVDIDGNDYWVWDSIEVVKPRIVIVEYNSRFGATRAVTVPYDPGFERARAHHSLIYYGASLRALEILGRRKGYALVACNSAGNNAFFVRLDCLPADLPPRTAADAFVAGSFRESRDASGALHFLSAREEQELLRSLPLEDVER